jgi:hypothetical protein
MVERTGGEDPPTLGATARQARKTQPLSGLRTLLSTGWLPKPATILAPSGTCSHRELWSGCWFLDVGLWMHLWMSIFQKSRVWSLKSKV